MNKFGFEKEMSRRSFIGSSLKTTLALGVLAGSGGLLAACSNIASTTSKNNSSGGKGKNGLIHGTISNQTFNLENTYFSVFDNSVKEAAAALGISHMFQQHNGDSALQLSQVDQLSTNQGKGIITYAPTAGVVPTFAQACQNKQLYMVNIWNTPAWFTPLNVGDYYVQYSEYDGRRMGYDIAVALFKKIGGKGTVLHIPGFPGTSSDDGRTFGIKKALKEYPDIKIITGQPGNWNRIDSKKAMEDLLVSANSFDGVIGQNDDQTQGILQALKERKVNVPVVSMDGTPEGLKSVINGDVLCTSAMVTTHEGGNALVQIFDAMNGWKPSVPERMMFHDPVFVTKDNAQQVYDKMYGGKTTGFDWVKMSRTLTPNNWDPQLGMSPIDVWEYWNGKKVNSGMGLPSEYKTAKSKGEWKRVTELYQKQYKKKFI
ncbi:sugar ABC transporter substrate-binding protein [Neobacillus sp. NPDC093182]|uniref:sugar ABC transporter substrate-binding protein n=1 Tax=Neobacillus sp. NPDC093182 TaxID=3364297 RepID=UPI00382D20C3